MAHTQIVQEDNNQKETPQKAEYNKKSDKPLRVSTNNSGEVQAHAKQRTPGDSQGFEIAGFPWQFVLVMAVIALALIGIVLRTIITF